MLRVLVDGQIAGADGIGRYTTCLTVALRRVGGEGLELCTVPASAPRYTTAEGANLVDSVRHHRAELLHLPDYRVPLEPAPVPMLVTVHDVLRLRAPQYCYPDGVFAHRYGGNALAGLSASVEKLRITTRWPPGATRRPRSLHEEFYGRMLWLAAERAARIVVPTRTVADHLDEALGRDTDTIVAPPGTDHLRLPGPPPPLPAPLRSAGYLLYVGQNRAHKGLSTTMRGYLHSSAPRRDIPLVFVGRDFGAGRPAAAWATAAAGRHAVCLGEVGDELLGSLYAQAAGLLHLSHHEGFGFTPLEALATGCPVIVSDLPVLRETLGLHGTFVPPGDTSQLPQAIDALLGRRPSGAAAQQQRTAWAARYRWDTHARRILRCYAEVHQGGVRSYKSKGHQSG